MDDQLFLSPSFGSDEQFFRALENEPHYSPQCPIHGENRFQFVNLPMLERGAPLSPPFQEQKKSEYQLPLERYLCSPWEDDPALLARIKATAQTSTPPPDNPPPLIQSFDNSDVSSTLTGCTYTSMSSGSTLAYQERRKRKRTNSPRQKKATSPSKDTLYCTFCPKKFPNTGNWTRHENEFHLVVNKWVCALHGGSVNGCCVYCEQSEELCVCTPTAKICAGKTLDARTFTRKGHLQQHLNKVHGVKREELLDRWMVSGKWPATSRCGFCGEIFDDWEKRVKHLAWEFKTNKLTMENWEGDWGLEERWMNRLQGVKFLAYRPKRMGG